jgi:hypothetical protein
MGGEINNGNVKGNVAFIDRFNKVADGMEFQHQVHGPKQPAWQWALPTPFPCRHRRIVVVTGLQLRLS